MIEIKNLNKIYKDKTVALTNVNLTFPDTGLFLIVGPSGAGKSTLLNILAGCDDNYNGVVSLDGKDIRHIVCYTNKYVSYATQDDQLIDSLNVRDNLCLLEESDELKSLNLLEIFGLKDRMESDILSLSGGERERVSLVRAILEDKKILLCDEVTSSLDYDKTEMVLRTLKEISKKSLVIVVSHDEMLYSSYVDGVIRFNDGRVLNNIESKTNTMNNASKKIKYRGLRNKIKKYIIKNTFTSNKKSSISAFLQEFIFIFLMLILFGVVYSDINALYAELLIPNNRVIRIDYEQPLNLDIIKYSSKVREAIIKPDVSFAFSVDDDTSLFYSGDMSNIGIMSYDDDIELLVGDEPVNSYDIVISEILAEYILYFDVNVEGTSTQVVSDYRDLIGMMIPLENASWKIVGIFKQNLTEYENLKSAKLLNNRRLNVFYNKFINETFTIGNILYVSDDMYRSIKDDSDYTYFIAEFNDERKLSEFLKDSANENIIVTTSFSTDIYNIFDILEKIKVIASIVLIVIMLILIVAIINKNITVIDLASLDINIFNNIGIRKREILSIYGANGLIISLISFIGAFFLFVILIGAFNALLYEITYIPLVLFKINWLVAIILIFLLVVFNLSVSGIAIFKRRIP